MWELLNEYLFIVTDRVARTPQAPPSERERDLYNEINRCFTTIDFWLAAEEATNED